MSYIINPISCHDLAIKSVVTYGFLVDAELDEDELKHGLDLVVDRWPIIGSSIAMEEGTYVYQTPTTTGYTFNSRTIGHVPFPCATPGISIHPMPDNSVFLPPAHLAQSNISGYVFTQQPILHLQITHTSNGTAVGLTIPHCFADAGGMKEIISAWTTVLRQGSLKDLNEDTLFLEHINAPIDEVPPGLWLHDTIVPLAPGQAEARWIFVPDDILASMKESCMKELGEGQWVSKGDVLYAWLVKAITSTGVALPTVLTIPINIRGRLPELPTPYLHNAIHAATHVFPSVTALQQSSLTDIALAIRRSIQNTDAELIRQHLAYKTAHKGGTVAVTNSPPGVERVTLSNWLGMDFGGNWMDRGRARSKGTGRLLWADVHFASSPGSRSVSVACRRDDQGVWMWVSLADWRWKTGLFGEMTEAK